MDFVKYMSLLTTSNLHFSRSDLLGDPFEGALPNVVARQRDLARQSNRDVTVNAWNVTHYGPHLRFRNYVSCWYESEYESAAMWNLYGGLSGAVAISTTFERISQALPSAHDPFSSISPPFAGRVKYIDYDTGQFPTNNGFIPFLYKRKSFEHEREVRIIFSSVARGEEDPYERDNAVLARSQPRAMSLPVDLSLLIENVFVHPGSDEWFRRLVESVSHKYGVKVHARQSKIADDPVY
ncbi:hypothetical protein B7R22_09875 [Subtercola boreus]|uniref:DUF2971 domain-containing protein n=2 Tax=Subtercola boreus TaxID=120213 RepID=A0A3E0VVS1_9MICO|nr:hypothetical protein B7R22_09875 [Subtercola boreus]